MHLTAVPSVLRDCVPCVAVPAGLVAVCDNRSLTEPDQSLPATAVMRTASGFTHWYSLTTGTLRGEHYAIAPGVELATTGYAAAGEVVTDAPVAPLPAVITAAALRLEHAGTTQPHDELIAALKRISNALYEHLS